jgi:hypothetical protein
MTRKIIGTAFVFTLLFSMMSFSVVFASSNPAISAAIVSAPDANGEFDVTVSITNNPGISHFTLRLHFDSSRIEPVSVTRGGAILGSITSNVNIAGINFVSAVWTDADGSNTNGLLYTVRFKVKEGALGKSIFTLTEHGLFDNTHAMNPVSATLSGTEIDLGGPSADAVIISAEATTPDTNGEFDVAVSISNNTGIAHFTLRLHFDATKIEPISLTRGGAVSGSITSNVNISGITFVSAVWTDADGSNANGMLYTVRFRAKEGAAGTAAFSITEHGLFDNTHAMESVTALLSGTSINLIAAVTAPPAPTITNITSGDAQVTVIFTEVSGADSYTVTAMPGNITATGTSSPIVVGGLANGVPHTFTITATNAGGTSPASSPSNPVTPTLNDNPPTGIPAITSYFTTLVIFIMLSSVLWGFVLWHKSKHRIVQTSE